MKDRDIAVQAANPCAIDLESVGTTPTVIECAGPKARTRFIEFFAATIRCENTRMAYARAAARFFGWCQHHGLALHDIEPLHVAAFIESHPGSPPTVKQHLAAIRMLFDWLVIGQVVAMNPAS